MENSIAKESAKYHELCAYQTLYPGKTFDEAKQLIEQRFSMEFPDIVGKIEKTCDALKDILLYNLTLFYVGWDNFEEFKD